MMKPDNEIMGMDRRNFIKSVLNGTIAGSLLLVLPMGARALDVKPQIPSVIGKEWNKGKRRFAFIVDITRCIGCGSCCVADKAEFNVPDGNYRTWVERYVKGFDDEIYVDSPNGGLDGYLEPRQDLHVKVRDTYFVPKLCNMCQDPPCVQVCPVGATFQTPDGFVLIDNKRCVGCAYCIQACPYSVRFLNPVTKNAEKCSWCYHRVRKGLLPACVDVCPAGARKFGDLDDPEAEVTKLLNGPGVITVLKKDMGTEPSLFYIGARREVV